MQFGPSNIYLVPLNPRIKPSLNSNSVRDPAIHEMKFFSYLTRVKKKIGTFGLLFSRTKDVLPCSFPIKYMKHWLNCWGKGTFTPLRAGYTVYILFYFNLFYFILFFPEMWILPSGMTRMLNCSRFKGFN